ncbi:dTDP-4-dehydrorhamnose reductase [Cohnella sp. GCM10027633]|uniref:dTDP-4-dehydrorhamnose reductase n=1 Tax=unclassified Cohnella TaxID=2636738 RepID=UPI00362AD6B6
MIVESRTDYTIAVTGAGGQLGQELTRLSMPNARIIGFDRYQLDITDADQCKRVIAGIKPDAIIHAAAYTAVDRAESDPDGAYLVNVVGTRNVANAAESVGAKLCYVSTDYVFDGQGTKPYGEMDITAPQSVYGKTKLEGERQAVMHCSRAFIARTSWVYGQYGNNFVRTMLQFASKNTVLKVVNDQTGSPTYTLDLAMLLVRLVETDYFGTYHATNTGQCTWYEFAKAIFEEAGLTEIVVLPCTTEEFPRPAPRPSYSVLGQQALANAGLHPLRHWREALSEYISNARTD